jgi:Cu-processing system ATP-binding protein
MLKISKISKSYGDRQVIKPTSFEVRSGSVAALMGHNGSGKSTILKIVLGLVRPDSGEMRFGESVIGDDPSFRRRIGYMPQQARFPDHLAVSEVIALLQDLRGNPKDLDLELIEAFDLQSEMSQRIQHLSGGTRQKLSACLSVMFRPELLIMDEPTASLDPIAASILKAKIRRLRDDGVTVVLSSHIVSEVETMCDTLVFLNDGNVVFSGLMETLKATTGSATLEEAINIRMKRQVENQSNTTEFKNGILAWALSAR